MIKAMCGKIPKKTLCHSSSLANWNGDTVAMLLAENKIVPPDDWFHNPNIKNKERKTVRDIFI